MNNTLQDDQVLLSPLRYPGAKRRLWSYIAEVFRLNGLRPRAFIEPFAGGASVSLQLLQADCVESIVLGEADPLLASFWKTVFYDSEWLIEAIRDLKISLTTWRAFKHGQQKSDRERAIACLFLNRTSFSGIVAPSGGPIGGQLQESDYKIDCRFTKATIEKRICKAASLRDRVALVLNADWKETVKRSRRLDYGSKEKFYYLDPPFYNKSHRLYTHYFNHANHVKLHDFLTTMREPWLLSYDVAPEVMGLYSANGIGPRRIDSLYSVRSSGPVRAEELIITNLDRLPHETRLWRSTVEWRSHRREVAKERPERHLLKGSQRQHQTG